MYNCVNATEQLRGSCSCGGDSEMFCKAASKDPRYIEPYGCELLESITELDPAHEAMQSAILFGVTIAIFSAAVFFYAVRLRMAFVALPSSLSFFRSAALPSITFVFALTSPSLSFSLPSHTRTHTRLPLPL